MESETDLPTHENKLKQILSKVDMSEMLLLFHCLAVVSMVI